MDDQYAVDVDFEIAGLDLEIEDLRRDMKWTGWIGCIALAITYFVGDFALTEIERALAYATIIIIAGVKDHLYRNRLRQAHDQLINLKLWAQAELQNGRRTMRVVRAIADLPQATDVR